MRFRSSTAWLLLALGVAALIGAPARPRAEEPPPPTEDCTASSGDMQLLTKITNTRDADFHCLGVSLDGQANIRAIRFETHIFDIDAARRPISRVKLKEFPPQEVGDTKGAVLDGVPGHDAILLQGQIVDGQAHDDLVIRFLYNGITNEFHECGFALDRHGADWQAVNLRNAPVSLAVIRTRAVPIIGTIGIETIDGFCS